MAQIKPMPTHIREYYKAMREHYTQEKEKAEKKLEELNNNIKVLRDAILERHETYLSFKINLSDFPEFINNEYNDGKFLRVAEGAFLNRSNNYELTSDLHKLLKLAKMQKEISELSKSLDLYKRILSFNVREYIRYIREFFNEVHAKMIIEGCAYGYGHRLGYAIINRVKHQENRRKCLDFAATKAKKAEIKARGGRLYNKEEAEWCEKNGIEYNGEDGRVYLNTEYFYEIFLYSNVFHMSGFYEFTPQDYRGSELRGKTNAQLIEECDRDLYKICKLPVDLKTKINMCTEVDKMLYTNFIRNEGQTSYNNTTASR